MGSQLKKGETSQSTQNRVWYSYCGLHLFDLMVKANTNAKGKHWKTKKKLSKLDLCRYMAEHHKPFRAFWLKFHPGKTFPKHENGRKAIGTAFYKSNVADSRRSGRRSKLNEIVKMLTPGKKREGYYFHQGKKVKIKL